MEEPRPALAQYPIFACFSMSLFHLPALSRGLHSKPRCIGQTVTAMGTTSREALQSKASSLIKRVIKHVLCLQKKILFQGAAGPSDEGG